MKKHKLVISILSLFFLHFPYLDAKNTIDSILSVEKNYTKSVVLLRNQTTEALEAAFGNATVQLNKIKLLNALCWKYFNSSPTKSLNYAKEQMALVSTFSNIEAKIAAFDNLGNLYKYMGDYEKSLNYLLEGLRLKEEMNDTNSIAVTLNSIATVYYFMENNLRALEYWEQNLRIYEKINNNAGLSATLNNVALIYTENKKYDIALEFYNRAMQIDQKQNNLRGVAISLLNIGTVHLRMNNQDTALSYFHKSHNIYVQLKEEYNSIGVLKYIAEAYTNKGLFDKALEYGNKALSFAKQKQNKDKIKDSYLILSKTYSKKGDFKKAYEYNLLYTATKDSIFTDESQKSIAEMQTKYETEKKEKHIEIQNLQLSKQILELNKKQITIYASLGGLVLVILLAFFIYRSNRQKQKANMLLEEKNILIEEQKKIVEEKNKDITDSIRYAKRIQQAILPSDEKVKMALPQSFIFYQPRDIVSGDFYWMHHQDGTAFIAAVDCTGHGVPGAFMSMMGKDQLNYIVAEKNITSTSETLNILNKGIKNALQQRVNDELVQDGMEIALCRIDMKTNSVDFSGANRSLLVIHDAQLQEFLPDKFPIGGHTADNYEFNKHHIPLQKNDMIFLCSDGYADQFGGEKGKRFTTKRLKNLLLSICNLATSEQERIIYKTFSEWKGNLEQVDDVLVIGIKI